MKRAFFQFLAWLSLLLLGAVVALWVRSYSVANLWASYELSGRGANSVARFHNVEIARGKLGFSRHVEVSNGSPASGVISVCGFESDITRERSLPGDPHALVDQANRFGFFFQKQVASMWAGGTGWTTTLCIPFWLPASLLIPIPLLYAIGMWRKRRAKRRGLCLNCGYDLRESRERCPECAAPTAPPPRPSLARRVAPRFTATVVLAIGAVAGNWGIQQVQRRQTEAWLQAYASRHLIEAIKAGDMKGFLSALEYGADANTSAYADLPPGGGFFLSSPQDFPTALGVAVEAHNAQMVRELLRRGATADVNYSLATDPLYTAAGAGDVEIVRLLLKAGAHVYGMPSSGRIPLLAACAVGKVEVVRMLLDAGANVSVDDGKGRTALYMAVTANAHRWEIVSLMLAHQADPTIDSDSHRLLHAAIRWGDVNVVRALLAAGADVNADDDQGHTPMHALAAAPDHRAEMLSLLMSHHPKFNVLDAAGNSPLHLAIRNRDVQLVELLVKAGADVTFEDYRGRSVLDMFDNEAFPELAALLQPKETPAASQPSALPVR